MFNLLMAVVRMVTLAGCGGVSLCECGDHPVAKVVLVARDTPLGPWAYSNEGCVGCVDRLVEEYEEWMSGPVFVGVTEYLQDA